MSFRMHLIGTAAVLAHQGGWDELLMVAVPVAVFAALLYAANRRAERLGRPTTDPDGVGRAEDAPDRADRRRAHNATEFGTRPARGVGAQSSRSTSAPTARNRSTKPS